MKRIVLMGTAVAALFTAGITTAASAAASKTKTKSVSINSTCKLTLTTVAPPGSLGVIPGTAQGANLGVTSCGKPLGKGLTRQSFTLDEAGDLAGDIEHLFRGSSLYGSYKLTESAQTGPPTATNFGEASYAGTVHFYGAHGALRGTTGTAELNCNTTDSLHYACTEKLSLKQPETVPTTVKAAVKASG